MGTGSFRDLLCWRSAHEFVLKTYKDTECFPKSEIYGLTSQFRRAAVSIPANIAEGYKKTGVKDKLRFFNIAQGSLEECRYYVILSQSLNYINIAQCNALDKLLNDASRLLNAYCTKIHQSLPQNSLTSLTSLTPLTSLTSK
ncbi:MAG: four helix bundle protein [Candidatus Symbiothrix sp.]|jgi:four helix bundle protein|nr:four helix bundle protein [Candidatus Symbiothrix sp.]